MKVYLHTDRSGRDHRYVLRVRQEHGDKITDHAQLAELNPHIVVRFGLEWAENLVDAINDRQIDASNPIYP